MTIDDQLKAAERHMSLWVALMPDTRPPTLDQFLIWADSWGEEMITRGINRAARKARKMRDTEPMSLTDSVKYASSVMKNEGLGIRNHSPHLPRAIQHKEVTAL